MIRIDHISFELTAPGEDFARRLYADWDSFCRHCFEQVVEECCAPYDREKMLHEIERLDLDLGSIPEEDFYREFPKRLKEELLKALPAWETGTKENRERSDASRRDNLLFFLEQGYPNLEWADGDFNPAEEVEWLLSQSAALHTSFVIRAAQLCLEQEYALRRLLWQTDSVEIHLRVYAAALTEPSAGLREKQRFLSLMLEERPGIPVRFVHRTGSDGELQSMAALLDSPTVRQLMRTETREHAEVDLPPYWHYLYEWLIQYYPFNGLAVFGGKAEFIRHLHYRLLTFIRKRSDSPHLSKAELTFDFLLEVFEPAYYKEVLNAIYGLQSRNADGSPAYDGYLNRELYRIFMQLSLLESPAGTVGKTSGIVTTQEEACGQEAVLAILGEAENNVGTVQSFAFHEWNHRQESLSNVVQTAFEQIWNTAEGVANWLEDTAIPTGYKRELLQIAVTGHTQEWIALLRNTARTEKTLDTLTGYLSVLVLKQGMAKANFYQASVLSRVVERMERNADAFPFLATNGASLSSALSKALLRYMQDADTLERTLTEKEIIEKFLSLLYLIVYKGKTGPDYREDASWKQLAGMIMPEAEQQETVEPAKQGIAEKLLDWLENDGGSERDIPLPMESLAQTDLPETLRKRLLQHFLRFRSKELLVYIRRSAAEHSLPLARWTEWLDVGNWTNLAASLSLSVCELLRQVADVLHLDERVQRQVWGIWLTTGNKEKEWAYNNPEENIRSFVQAVASVQGEAEVEEVVQHIKEELHIQKETMPDMDDVSEFFPVGNAGLCLIAPWFVRLSGMLGYLDEERRKLKDTASKVRATFLLQYITYGEERVYRETELSFNRVLTGLSRHVPLPKQLPLTEEEKQTADSMMKGVKANWLQLKGTSVKGFRQSFIARSGTLEQQEERWLLTVEKKTHDILLESVPWSFRQIRLPWLKKYIQVIWNEKQEFI